MIKLTRLLLSLFSLSLLASPAYAFPDNGVLDAFTGSDDTTPPNANWTNAVLQGATSANVRIRSNAVTTANTSNEADAYYNAASFGAGCEAYATIVSVTPTVDFGTVYCRLANIGANTTDGYAVYWDDTNGEVGIGRIDDGVYTEITAVISQAIGVGDAFGIRTEGDQICAWYKVAAGAWAELGCRTDATYSAGGSIGLSILGSSATTGVLDDFGGGDIAAAASILQRGGTPAGLGF